MMTLRILVSSLCALFLFVSCQTDRNQVAEENMAEKENNKSSFWVGTYTQKEGHVDGKAAGIYGVGLNGDQFETFYTQSGIVNPSFVCQSPGGNYLFAVSELGSGGVNTGYVHSYRIENDSLILINKQPSFSLAPCHVSTSATGDRLYITNYVGGMIARYPITKNGDILPPTDTLRLEGSGLTDRQESSHPHSATLSPDGHWLMVADLGTDRVHSFRANTDKWEEDTHITLPPGSGPRHMAFHPKAPYAFVLNELNSTVTACHYNADNGALNIIDHYPTLPSENKEVANYCADIHLTPNGKYLYASNRGHDSIVAYEVDSSNGKLQLIGHFPTRGDFPRNFAIHPSGEFLLVANQNSDNVVQFNIASETGVLSFEYEWELKTPVCIVFD